MPGVEITDEIIHSTGERTFLFVWKGMEDWWIIS